MERSHEYVIVTVNTLQSSSDLLLQTAVLSKQIDYWLVRAGTYLSTTKVSRQRLVVQHYPCVFVTAVNILF